MINFSKISNKSILGKILRFPLKLIPGNIVLPILQGPNIGFRWVKGSGVNGYWMGCYEIKKQKLIAKYIKKGMTCYDISAHAGYYTLMFSKFSGESGKVFSFEPNPLNIISLLKHLELNIIKNVKVFPIGLYERKDFTSFILNSSISHLEWRKKEKLFVPTFKIDDLVSLKDIFQPPNFIKIDVEGAELEVLKGAKNVLKDNSIITFVALDNLRTRKEIFVFLNKIGYKLYNFECREIGLDEISNINEIIGKKE